MRRRSASAASTPRARLARSCSVRFRSSRFSACAAFGPSISRAHAEWPIAITRVTYIATTRNSRPTSVSGSASPGCPPSTT